MHLMLSFDEQNGLMMIDVSHEPETTQWMLSVPMETIVFLVARNDEVAEILKRTSVKRVICLSPESEKWAQQKFPPPMVVLSRLGQPAKVMEVTIDIGDGRGGVFWMQVPYSPAYTDLLLLLLSTLNEFGNLQSSSSPLSLHAKYLLDQRVIEELRKNKNLTNVTCYLTEFSLTKILGNLRDNTNITCSSIFTDLAARHRSRRT